MLQLEHLSKRYGKKPIFDDLTIKFDQPGTLNVIIGASGTGKTTLLNLLFGLDRDYQGQYLINGTDAKKLTNQDWAKIRSQSVQISYQDFKLLNHLTAWENLQIADRKFTGEWKKRGMQLLEQFNLSDVKNQLVKNLSGGQKQRLAIARAMLNQPAVLLLDEPTGNLDAANTEQLMQYLNQAKQQGTIIIMITHDDRVLPFADQVYRLEHRTLNVVKDSEVVASTKTPFSRVRSEHHLKSGKTPMGRIIRYVRYMWKRHWWTNLLNGVPIVLILMILSLIFTAGKQISLNSFTEAFQGVNSRTILLDTQALTGKVQKQLNKKGIEDSTDGQRFYFSQADLKKIAKIKAVEKVVPFTGQTGTRDLQKNELVQSVDKSELPTSMEKMRSYGNAPDAIQLHFSSLIVPASALREYNPKHLELAEGKMPKADNEVLLPDAVAKIYSAKVGGKVTLKVKTPKNKFESKAYQVSGIYRTNYQTALDAIYTIYTPYNSVASELVHDSQNKKGYQELKDGIANQQTAEYLKPMTESYADYLASLGTGNEYVLVVAKSANQVEAVSKACRKLFPSYQQKSQYEMKHGEFKSLYRSLMLGLIVGAGLLATISGLIFIFLNKSQLNQRYRELATLYSLGYERRDIRRILVLEMFGLFISYYIVTVGLLAAAWYGYLISSSYAGLFSQILSPVNLLSILGMMIVTGMISILWGLAGIKQNKLNRYLQLD
jgi:putative ABC transport system permease protein